MQQKSGKAHPSCIRYGWREPIWVIYRLPKVIHAGSVWERNLSHGREHMFNLDAISALVLLRSTFGVIEHLRGNDGPLLRSDVYLYIFDAVSIFLVTLLSTCICPTEITKDMKGRGDMEESATAASRSHGWHPFRSGREQHRTVHRRASLLVGIHQTRTCKKVESLSLKRYSSPRMKRQLQ